MNSYSFDAVIFDLDGVITKTALVHAKAWKEMFDEYLRQRERDHGEVFSEFTHDNDYLPYVDGKPRYKGVESFLLSRGISIPYGDPTDSTEMETVCGLGNRKNQALNKVLQADGVEVYPSTIDLMNELRDAGILLGVASSSKNCKQVLERANLIHYFQTRVDGEVSAQLGLHGKPEPDIFTVAADNLGVSYFRTVVIEDAVSGVQAARKGNFGFVLGIAREKNENELKLNGADIVVADLKEINGIKGIEKWFDDGLFRDLWSLSYQGYDLNEEPTREPLLALGNGYFVTHGALEELEVDPFCRPTTCMANLFYGLKSPFDDQKTNIEDFVDIPNWIPITFKVGEGEWFDPTKDKILRLERSLNLLNGVLVKRMVVQDSKGNESLIESYRIVSLANKHHAAIDYSITPLNYSGTIRVRSAIALPKLNNGLKKNLNKSEPFQQGGKGNISFAAAKAFQKDIVIAAAAQLGVYYEDRPLATDFVIKQGKGWVNTYFKAAINKDKLFRIEKLVSLCNSFSGETADPLGFVVDDAAKLRTFGIMHAASIEEWEKLWRNADVKVPNDRQGQKEKRLQIYHGLVANPPK